MTQAIILKTLDTLYEKAINPAVNALDSAYDLARDYLAKEGRIEEKVDSLIRWQVAKSSSSGFLTSLGGLITLPVAIPANISSTLYIQLRMSAAIAYMGGYDPEDDRLKTFVYATLVGNAAREVLRDVGVKVSQKIAYNIIKKISGNTLEKINEAVGFKLFTKFCQTGVTNLGKAIPIIGGIVGGLIDGASTLAVGKAAKSLFIQN